MARERGAHVHFDMEHYDAKDLTLALFRDLLSEDEFADVAAGIVIQAYLRDARDDLADLIAWSGGRRTPITVRLVKGAYWDAETVHARASGWTAAGVRAQGRDRRQLRALRPAPPRPPRRGAGRLRIAQPPFARLRGELRPPPGRPRPRLRGAAALRHGRTRARGDQAARAAAAGVRPGRRAGAGHGLPGASPAREHLQRELRPAPLRRGTRPRRARRAARRSSRSPGRPSRRSSSRPIRDAPSPYEPEPLREWRRGSARAASRWRSIGSATASASEVPAVIAGEQVHTAATIVSVDPAQIERGRRHVGLVHRGRRRRRRRGRGRRGTRVAAHPRESSEPRSCSERPTGCVSVATSWLPSSASRRPSRGTRPMATCARRSTSASTTGARCCAWPAPPLTSCNRPRARRTA